jgi:DNA-binding MarR family transcriptional regulator
MHEDLDKLQHLNKLIYKKIVEIWTEISPYKLNRQQAKLLMFMKREGGRLKVSELAELLCVTAGGLTLMSDKLVEMGLVNRLRDDTDRRIVYLELTDGGESAVTEITKAMSRLTQQLRQGVSDEELELLEHMYTMLLRNADAFLESLYK